MCEDTLTNSLWLENFWKKNRRWNKGERDQNLAFNLVILMRIPPNFLSKSRVLHLVCTPTGVYSRKGGPRSSHVLRFQKYIYVDNYEWRWKLCLCSSQEFYFKVLKVQHWVKDIKNLVESQVDLIWRFLNKKKFVCVPFYPGRGISGAFYSDEIQS